MSLVYTPFSPEQLAFLDALRKPENKDASLEEGASGSAIVFAEHMLGMKLYYWEVAFLYKLQAVMEKREINPLFGSLPGVKTMVLALTSRQIGKSTILAVFSLWASFFNKSPDKRFSSTQVLIVSRSFDQAKKLLREIKRTFQDGDSFMRENYLDEDDLPVFGKNYFSSRLAKDDGNNATAINWRKYDEHKDGLWALKGSRANSGIRCYAPTDVVLGETFTIGMVDEAGHKKIEDDWWFDSLKKTGDANRALWVFTSTPWTPSGFFYEYCDLEDKNGTEYIEDDWWFDSLKKTGDANRALWVFTSTPWTPSGFFYEYCDLEDKNGTEYIEKIVATIDTLKQDIDGGNEFAREQYEGVIDDIKRDEELGKLDSVRRGYYCEFVQGDDNYFNPEKINASFKKDFFMVNEYSGECDLGVDFGAQKVSKTTLTISALVDNRIVRLWHRVYTKGSDLHLLDDIEELFSRFNIQRIVPDSCPAGSFMIEDMIQRGWNVTPMEFRTWKVKKYGAFRSKLNREEVDSYVDDDLIKEMRAMQYSQGSTQSKIQHAPGYSDDMIDGFVMSCFHFLSVDDTVKFYEW